MNQIIETTTVSTPAAREEKRQQRIAEILEQCGHGIAADIFAGDEVEADVTAKADILSAAIADRKVQRWVQDALIPMRNGFRAEEAKAARLAREEAAKKRGAVVAAQVTKVERLVMQFAAHNKVGNIGGMEAVVRELRGTDVQAGLIKATGTPAARDAFLNDCRTQIALAASRKRNKRK